MYKRIYGKRQDGFKDFLQNIAKVFDPNSEQPNFYYDDSNNIPLYDQIQDIVGAEEDTDDEEYDDNDMDEINFFLFDN